MLRRQAPGVPGEFLAGVDDRIHGRVGGQRPEHVRGQGRPGGDLAGEVRRIERTAEGQQPSERALRAGLDRHDVQARLGGKIRQRAGLPAGDRHQPDPGRPWRAVGQEELGDGHDLAELADPEHTERPEQRLVHPVRAGQRAGMGGGASRGRLGAPDLNERDRLAQLGGQARDGHEVLRPPDRLEKRQHHAHAGILHRDRQVVGETEVDLVARARVVAHTDTLALKPRDQRARPTRRSE